MEATITDLLNSETCTPILLGLILGDFVSCHNLCPLDWHQPVRPWTFRTEIIHQSQDVSSKTHSRIDYILLPTHISKSNSNATNAATHSQLFCYTDDRGFKHSDHIPLIANLSTNVLGAKIKKLQLPMVSNQPEKVFVRPIKPTDLDRLHCALKDPAYKPCVTHNQMQGTLNSTFESAVEHLYSIEGTCAKQQTKLSHLINNIPATQVVENLAGKLITLLKECHNVALQVCATKIRMGQAQNFRTRRVNKARKSLCNQLKAVKHVMYNLPEAHLTHTFEEALDKTHHTPNLHRAILFVKTRCSTRDSQGDESPSF